jgi:hypothetical protein
MDLRKRYDKARQKLNTDHSICSENQQLFAEYLAFQEYKLKRINGLSALDNSTLKTLLTCITRLRTVNRWFANKPWRGLRRSDIKRVYDDLEDGKISTLRGHPFRDRFTYYRKILRGKPFEMAGKAQLVKDVMQFVPVQKQEDVRFITEETFRELVEVTSKVEHRAFLWLCWDIGENASSLLQLRKGDCNRQINEATREPEYLINLPKAILKRSRKSRTEITSYPETVYYLDVLLKSAEEGGLLFRFGAAWGKKLLARAVQKTGARCRPGGQPVTLKDLRSSMACDLLSKGWSRDEVNARLGHVPSSKEIDRYINYLAIDKARPKRKLQQFETARLVEEIDQIRHREKGIIAQLDSVKRSRDEYVQRLKRLVDIHAGIAALGLEHQLGKLTNQEYARALAKAHRELLLEREQMDALEIPTDGISHN